MIIGACGFGSTGSSAITDYLCEFDDIQSMDDMEMTFVWVPDGLIDLEYHLMHPHGQTLDSMFALERYVQLIKNNIRRFGAYGFTTAAVRDSTERFVDAITDVSWKYYKPGQRFSYRSLSFPLAFWTSRVIPYLERKKGKQIEVFPLQDVRLSVCPDQFYEAARKHVKEILIAGGADFNKRIVLNQPFPGSAPQSCFPFFEDPYAIVSDRDPRDIYVFAQTQLLGINHFMPLKSVSDYITYYRKQRENQPYLQENDRVLNIRFEDMVYNYDNTTERIRNFLKLPENRRAKTIFDPAQSVANTQVFRRFPEYADDVKRIEDELTDYLFDFDQYPKIQNDGKMFFDRTPNRPRAKRSFWDMLFK